MRAHTSLGGTPANKPALLVLAAGMGSRYGGLKQVEPVGPSGETIMDYSVYDALRAGFGRLVFVIRRDIETAFRQTIAARFDQRLPVDYVFQELDRLPASFTPPPNRRKPWGTGHAILMAGRPSANPSGSSTPTISTGATPTSCLPGISSPPARTMPWSVSS